jgi:hypothetical protein
VALNTAWWARNEVSFSKKNNVNRYLSKEVKEDKGPLFLGDLMT